MDDIVIKIVGINFSPITSVFYDLDPDASALGGNLAPKDPKDSERIVFIHAE